MYKGEPHKKSKCRIKINLDVTNFQPNKSTTQIWVVRGGGGVMMCHHPDQGSDTSSLWNRWARSLDVMSGVGGRGRGEASHGVGK